MTVRRRSTFAPPSRRTAWGRVLLLAHNATSAEWVFIGGMTGVALGLAAILLWIIQGGRA